MLTIAVGCVLSLAQQTPATGQGDLAAEVEAIRAEFELPALAGALVDRSGRIVEVGVAGTTAAHADAPVGLDAAWHLGSCLKATTATLGAIAVERELFTWTSSPAEVFAESVETIDPSWSEVTFEQLLSHRAGAPSAFGDRALWMRLIGHDGPPAAARAELVEWLLAQPTTFEPGSAYAYSNEGYVLAGAMVAAAGGATFEELLDRWLLEPLAIEGAGFGAPTGDGDPRGHRLNGEALSAINPGRFADNPPALAPAGTAHMPLSGWAKLVGVHLRRGVGEAELLRPSTFEALHRSRGDGYALGWATARRGWSEGPVLTHSGSNTMWFSTAWLAPEEGFAVLVCTNAGHDPARAACDKLAGLLIRREVERNAED